MTVQTDTRNANLADLVTLLQGQHARKLDVVAPAHSIRSVDGQLVLTGTEAHIDADGVTTADGTYRPTEICDGGIADKLGIPGGYLKRMRSSRPDLFDANVNGWLHGWAGPTDTDREQERDTADPRSFLIRCFRGDDGGEGVARALLSDRYGIIDNLDLLLAALDGVRQTAIDVQVTGCDLTERRMYVRVSAPQVAAYAPKLLEGYRSPFSGERVGGHWTPEAIARVAGREGQRIEPGTEPVVFAGFEIGNSETGGGAWTITPRLTVQVCNNGLTITADALRGVHLGGKLQGGLIRWSDDTERKALELVTARTSDAVATFLDVEYVTAKVAELEQKAGTEVTDANKTIEVVCKALSFTEDQQATILSHFIKGGQMTAGGVMQAVTSAAQVHEDVDTAHDMEAAAVKVLELAAAAQ
jgi:hypothetical protein